MKIRRKKNKFAEKLPAKPDKSKDRTEKDGDDSDSNRKGINRRDSNENKENKDKLAEKLPAKPDKSKKISKKDSNKPKRDKNESNKEESEKSKANKDALAMELLLKLKNLIPKTKLAAWVKLQRKGELVSDPEVGAELLSLTVGHQEIQELVKKVFL